MTHVVDSDRRRSSVVRVMGANAVARLVVLPVSAVLGLLVTRVVISEYGEPTYAQYALLVGIGALIPFADLGIGAAVMNAVAESDDPREDDHLRAVLVSSLRVLTTSASVVIVLSLVISVTGSWDALLGGGLLAGSGAVAAALCLSVVGVTLTVSVGQRVLMGLGRLYIVILLNGLQTPLVLTVLLLLVAFDVGSGAYLALVAYVATFVIAAITLVVANRSIRPTLRRAATDAPRLRSVRGARVFDTALPMAVQMVALPLAMQSDRLVLSHVSDLDALTEYSLAAQMFNPFVGVIAAAGMALWPVFAKARADGVRSVVSPARMSLIFGAIAVALGLGISLASGFLADLASHGTIELSAPLVAAFSILLVLQAVKYPFGMYMTDPRGLRYQAVMVVCMLPVNLGVSIVLAREYGAVGPVVGSIVGVLVFQVLANWFYVQRDRARTLGAEPV